MTSIYFVKFNLTHLYTMGASQSRGVAPAVIRGSGRIPSGSGAPRPIAPGSGISFRGGEGVINGTGTLVGFGGDVKPVFGSR